MYISHEERPVLLSVIFGLFQIRNLADDELLDCIVRKEFAAGHLCYCLQYPGLAVGKDHREIYL